MPNCDLKKPLPYDGEMFHPKKKRFKEIIVFTHHYGGHKNQMKRHIQFVNDLGFSAYAFNLFPQPFTHSLALLKHSEVYFSNLSQIWGRQISDTLCLIPGRKIIFSFSFSCNTVIQTAPRLSNLQAVIFDGGPFCHFFKNSWLYLSYREVIKNPFLRAATVVPWNIFFDFFFLKFKIKKVLKNWPVNLPILSFQAEEDKLCPPSSINTVLAPHTQLNITHALVPKAGHLQGLKLQPELYKKTLKNFLVQKCQSL